MTLDTSERHPICLILNFAHGESEDGMLDDKPVLWKDLMAEGMVARTPGLKEKIPFKVVPTGRSSSRDGNITVSMSDLIEAFDAKAFQDVTIPDGHPKPDRVLPDGKIIKGDSALNNTGYVRGLRVVKKRVKRPDGNGPEIHVLQAGLGFTEPDVAAKVKRGSVPNISAGVFFDFVRKHDDRYFRAALNHAALTKQPWMQDLEPFQRAYFSADENEYEFQQVLLADDNPDDTKDAKVIWKEEVSSGFIREALSKALNPEPTLGSDVIGVPERPRAFYYVSDVTHNEPNLAQVEESYRGKTTRWVVPYSQGDDGVVSPSPQTHWQEGTMAMIAASDDDETVASFEQNTLDRVRDRLAVALDDMFGDGHKLVVGTVSTDGRALVRNTDTGAEHIARFREVGRHAYMADTAEWTTVKLPVSKTPAPASASGTMFDVTANNVVTLDTTTPEGRVAAARQRRAQLLSTSH
jgi:hypothetical protein